MLAKEYFTNRTRASAQLTLSSAVAGQDQESEPQEDSQEKDMLNEQNFALEDRSMLTAQGLPATEEGLDTAMQTLAQEVRYGFNVFLTGRHAIHQHSHCKDSKVKRTNYRVLSATLLSSKDNACKDTFQGNHISQYNKKSVQHSSCRMACNATAMHLADMVAQTPHAYNTRSCCQAVGARLFCRS